MQKGNIDGNYAEWWATRGKSFQDNAIGPVRANLVRAGEIEFKDIVYKNGNMIPINQLKIPEKALKEARMRNTI